MKETDTPRRAARADTHEPSPKALAVGARKVAFGLLLFLLAHPFGAHARQASAGAPKLPSPEKIVGEYLKAAGGKKRLAAIRDAVYEWTIEGGAQGESRARVLTKAPASARSELYTGGIEVVGAANARTAWQKDSDSGVRTLTGAEAHTAKLQAALGASRFVDLKKLKVLARTVGVEQVGGERAYAVEFSTKEGARVRFWFGASSKLLLKTTDFQDGGSYTYGDYRPVGGVLEPHRTVHEAGGKPDATFVLRDVRHNTGLADALFDPPADAALDIPALLRQLAGNQEEVDRRINDYTFMHKVTERDVNDRGVVKKEKVLVYEVYPVAGGPWVEKLVSENGSKLSPEHAAREQRRVAEELAEAEREAPKRELERRRRRFERETKAKLREAGDPDAKEDDGEVGIATFLRASELVSPRRERFRERDAIVFDFRPRPGFRARTRAESVVAKLAGVIWIDPSERQVMRLEARLVEGFKMGGGLVASIKPGAALVFEQTRLEDGIWLPRFSQVNLSARFLLFAGKTVNETHEFSDYKRFSTKTGDATIESPKERP